MTDGFRTDNDLLSRRAGAFDGLAERAGRIVDDLRAGVESHGQCWGNDDAGRAFAEGHVGPARAALRGIGDLPDGLTDVGSRLRATAITYAASDETGETAVRGAGREYL
jgi:hypothetical protein